MTITKIPESEANESASLQLLIDASSVVRELVENSLDANATEIDISLIDGGCKSIEVQDNGGGIRESDFELLATRNATSKITKFEDLTTTLNTFGFRGEALNSIAKLSSLTVKTRTKNSEEGWSLEYDNNGNLVSKEKCAMNFGTVIACKNIFSCFPVRRIQLVKGWAGKIKSLISLIQQYALVYPRIRFTLKNTTRGSKNNILFSSPGNFDDLFGIASFIYGKSITDEMIEWTFRCDEFCISGIITYLNFSPAITFQTVFVNKRPVLIQKIHLAIINSYKQHSSKAKPSFILNLDLNLQQIDVNCSPDKRTVYIAIEDYIATTIKIELSRFLQEMGVKSKSIKQNTPTSSQGVSQSMSQEASQPDSAPSSQIIKSARKSNEHAKYVASSFGKYTLKRYRQDYSIYRRDDTQPDEPVFGFEDVDSTTNIPNSSQNSDVATTDTPSSRGGVKKYNFIIDRVLNIDLSKFKQKIVVKKEPEQTTTRISDMVDSKRIEKHMFKDMEVCGQFNKGFIVTKLPMQSSGEHFKYSLFIIDQHAADEKARFEHLNKTVKIDCQQLIQPAFVKLPPNLLSVAYDNIEKLECNGFSLGDFAENGLFIRSFPVLFSHVLGENDFLELLQKLASVNEKLEECKNGALVWDYFESIPRPPRIWSILARRACKSAVKIGDDLDQRRMEQIKNTLSDLDHPWNCPHGRPTFKCLATAHEIDEHISSEN